MLIRYRDYAQVNKRERKKVWVRFVQRGVAIRCVYQLKKWWFNFKQNVSTSRL